MGEDKLVQATADRILPQCDQLHSAEARLDPNAPITIARIAEDIFAFRGFPMSYAAIEADPSLILAEAREAYREFTALRARTAELEAALKPFARHGMALGVLRGNQGPFRVFDDRGYREISADDFAAAASALQESPKPASATRVAGNRE